MHSQRTHPEHWPRWIRLVALSWLALGPLAAQTPPAISKEAKVKATFLFNFAQYVEWPATAFAATNAPLTIGVLGNDELGPFLEQLIQGEIIQNRPLLIKRSRVIEELAACHILFINRSEQPRLAAILTALRNAPLLTVSDLEQFATRGGVIGFVPKGNTIGFQINLEAASRARLKIDSRLLGLAEIVRRKSEESN